MSTTLIGTLGSTPVQHTGSLSASEPTDVFRFAIGSTRNINLSLNNISDGDDADLRLFRDVNGNGVFDATDLSQGAITSSVRTGNSDDGINIRANAGIYFAEVIRFPGSSGDVTYDLDLSATTPNSTAGFSNVLAEEVKLGNLSADVVRSGNISNGNTADVYQFSLGLFEGVNLGLNGLSADADIRLIQDRNNNGVVDAGEEIRRSTNGGTFRDSINNIVDSGNYLVQVAQFSSTATNYTLTFDHFATPTIP